MQKNVLATILDYLQSIKLRNKLLIIFGLLIVVFVLSISYLSNKKAGYYLDQSAAILIWK